MQPPRPVRIYRTYPQPDSPAPNIGPRERALAVFKYLLDIEPEQAKNHPQYLDIVRLFDRLEFPALAARHVTHILGLVVTRTQYSLLVHAFEQHHRRQRGEPLEPSLVEMISTMPKPPR